MEAEPDEVLWGRVVAGEPWLYGLIWDRHRDCIFRHVIRLGCAPSDAEDLTAATFLELWRRRGQVRFVDGSALPWLIVTSLNVYRNEARARRRYRHFLAALPPAEHAPDPAAMLENLDTARDARVRAAMSGARPADVRLLAMTALEGFSLKDAATAIGISESAAKMRLSRLRRRLGAAIEYNLTQGGVS
jgi:RNA polymerase sigma-70 factor (ECF subfamily)